jgi:hypothetical protein
MSDSTVTGSVNRFQLFRFPGLELVLLGLALLCVEPSSGNRAGVAADFVLAKLARFLAKGVETKI